MVRAGSQPDGAQTARYLDRQQSLAELLGIVHAGDQRAPSAKPETLRIGADEAWQVTSSFDLLEGRDRHVNTYVLVIHNERPFILGFTDSTQKPGPSGWIDDMLQRFQFLDEESAAPEWPTFTSQAAGFAIDVPQDWVEEPNEEPDAVWIHGSEGGLKIRVGDAEGNILNCDVPTGSPCRTWQLIRSKTWSACWRLTGRSRGAPMPPGRLV